MNYIYLSKRGNFLYNKKVLSFKYRLGMKVAFRKFLEMKKWSSISSCLFPSPVYTPVVHWVPLPYGVQWQMSQCLLPPWCCLLWKSNLNSFTCWSNSKCSVRKETAMLDPRSTDGLCLAVRDHSLMNSGMHIYRKNTKIKTKPSSDSGYLKIVILL